MWDHAVLYDRPRQQILDRGKETVTLTLKLFWRYTAVVSLLVLVGLTVVGCPNQEEAPDDTGDNAGDEDCVSPDEVAQLIDPLRDPAPEGCTGCHKDEHRLSNEVPEGHPGVAEDSELADCMQCHEDEFGQILHTFHLQSETYVQTLQGNCSGCHKMEDDGSIFVKGWEKQGD